MYGVMMPVDFDQTLSTSSELTISHADPHTWKTRTHTCTVGSIPKLNDLDMDAQKCLLEYLGLMGIAALIATGWCGH